MVEFWTNVHFLTILDMKYPKYKMICGTVMQPHLWNEYDNSDLIIVPLPVKFGSTRLSLAEPILYLVEQLLVCLIAKQPTSQNVSFEKLGQSK